MEVVRATGRRIFLGVEGLFNAAFGDRLNPFYRLGEISFFLFWIVAASGLYLYAFFKTGVQQAHGSVQMLHEAQPWAGGLLRSVHRYASDAMVVTMLLHLLRHFCFDRYRGYRWFSWISGVAVLWLVYVSGINGFMLPWDRLAQFVVVATTEWLDGLPLFSGRLVRNFIVDTAVSDRLFSLLSFLHIGVPLVLLLVLWIHIQRVPRARTVPPWPIAIPLALALIALSVAATGARQRAGGAREPAGDAGHGLVLPGDVSVHVRHLGRCCLGDAARGHAAARRAALVAAAARRARAGAPCSTREDATSWCAAARRCSMRDCARACRCDTSAAAAAAASARRG